MPALKIAYSHWNQTGKQNISQMEKYDLLSPSWQNYSDNVYAKESKITDLLYFCHNLYQENMLK